jgi:formylmethanofuran dehydrogenase subunit B
MTTLISSATALPHATQACPFCGLLCDDLPIEQLTREGFNAALATTDAHPRIRGEIATLDEAVAEAAKILRNAKQPLIAGLATDVAGMQAVVPLAEKLGAITDHMNSAVRRINTAAVQDTTGFYTTFAEARHRADVVVLCGGDMLSGFPRVFERVFPLQGEFLEGKRTFISLGDETTHRTYAATNSQVNISAALPSSPESFIDIVSALHCELRGAQHALKGNAAIMQIATLLKAAKYPVFVWNAASFVQPQPDLSVRALLALISTLNIKGRAAALMLGGSAGDATTEAVHLWQSGSPWGSRFSHGAVTHDPMRTSARDLLATSEVDAMLWIDSLGTGQQPCASAHIPLIVLSNKPYNTSAIITIPVGVSGIDHSAQLFRADRVVIVPLKALKRESTLPSVAQVMRKLLAAINEGAA